MEILKQYWTHKRIPLVTATLFVVWLVAHIPLIIYGTQDLPLHMSYIGDEQSPVNGALHILQDRSLLALRDLQTVYYGPVFSLIALPAILLDFGTKLLTGVVSNAEGYKNFILWSWGGIVIFARFVATTVGFVGVVGFYRLLRTKTFNPSNNRFLPFVGAALLATNFFYFEYAGFFKHWIFICAILIWQLYYLAKIFEEEKNTARYFVYEAILTVASFGISYLSIMFQVMWVPLLWYWWRNHNMPQLKRFFACVASAIILMLLVVLWHPHAFERILGLSTGDIANTDTSTLSTESSPTGLSFFYYGSILFNNNLPLLIAFAMLAIFAFRRRMYADPFSWSIGLLLLVYSLIFGIMGHHESRYILPVIILLITLLCYFAGQLTDTIQVNKILRSSFATLLVFYLIFNLVHLGKYLSIIKDGPQEKVAIQQITAMEEQKPASKTLFIAYYLVGGVHSKDAYQDYMTRFKKTQYNLYHILLASAPPSGIHELRMYYSRPDVPLPKNASKEYGQIIFRYEPKWEQNLDPDYLEINLVRLWFYKDFSDRYTFLKE